MKSMTRGSVIVEFALVAPFLVLLFLGAVSFGYDFHTYNRLEESVRAGSRFASMLNYDAYNDLDPRINSCALGPCASTTLSRSVPSAFRTAVENVVVYGTPTPSDTTPPIVEGLEPANVVIKLGIYGFGGSNPVAITNVTVGIQGFPLLSMVGTVVLNKPVTTFSYIGTYSPK